MRFDQIEGLARKPGGADRIAGVDYMYHTPFDHQKGYSFDHETGYAGVYPVAGVDVHIPEHRVRQYDQIL